MQGIIISIIVYQYVLLNNCDLLDIVLCRRKSLI